MTLKWDLGGVIGGMAVKDSFFIPCLDCDAIQRDIERTAVAYNVQIRIKKATENYIKGLRTWRIK